MGKTKKRPNLLTVTCYISLLLNWIMSGFAYSEKRRWRDIERVDRFLGCDKNIQRYGIKVGVGEMSGGDEVNWGQGEEGEWRKRDGERCQKRFGKISKKTENKNAFCLFYHYIKCACTFARTLHNLHAYQDTVRTFRS